MKTLKTALFLIFTVGGGVLLLYYTNFFTLNSNLPSFPEEMKESGVNMVLKEVRIVEQKGKETSLDLLASKAVMNKETAKVLVDDVSAILYQPDKPSVTVFSDKGILDEKSNDFELEGNIMVNLGKEGTLFTETLQWIAGERLFNTEDFVTIVSENLTLTGKGLTSEIDSQELEIKNDVSAYLRQ